MINTPPTAKLISRDDFQAIALMFPIGSRVRYLDSADHEQGQGQVVSLARSTNDALISVSLDGLGTHSVLSRFLEIV